MSPRFGPKLLWWYWTSWGNLVQLPPSIDTGWINYAVTCIGYVTHVRDLHIVREPPRSSTGGSGCIVFCLLLGTSCSLTPYPSRFWSIEPILGSSQGPRYHPVSSWTSHTHKTSSLVPALGYCYYLLPQIFFLAFQQWGELVLKS